MNALVENINNELVIRQVHDVATPTSYILNGSGLESPQYRMTSECEGLVLTAFSECRHIRVRDDVGLPNFTTLGVGAVIIGEVDDRLGDLYDLYSRRSELLRMVTVSDLYSTTTLMMKGLVGTSLSEEDVKTYDAHIDKVATIGIELLDIESKIDELAGDIYD